MNVLLLTLILIVSTTIMTFFCMKKRSVVSTAIFSILFGMIYGVGAYHMQPKQDFDIVRLQQIASKYENVTTIEEFAQKSSSDKLEIGPKVYSAIISKTGNLDLLQFFVVWAGYALLSFMIIDYQNKKQLKPASFIPIVIVILLGQDVLFYFSGLYNYLAIILFSFAYYIEQNYNKKLLPLFFYILSILTHTSIVLPISVLLFSKLWRGKIKMGAIIATVIIGLLAGPIVNIIADSVNIGVIEDARSLLNEYIASNDEFFGLYDGGYLIASILKILLVIISALLVSTKQKDSKIDNFPILMTILIMVLSFSSIAITRFTSIVLFAQLPVIAKASEQKQVIFFKVLLYMSALFFAMYSINELYPLY